MGEREDILRRFAERVRDGRWAVDTNYRNVREAARAALREAAALPPDDAQQRLDQIAKVVDHVWSIHGHRSQAAAAYGSMSEIGRLARGEEAP